MVEVYCTVPGAGVLDPLVSVHDGLEGGIDCIVPGKECNPPVSMHDGLEGGGCVLYLGQESLILEYMCMMDWRVVEVYCTWGRSVILQYLCMMDWRVADVYSVPGAGVLDPPLSVHDGLEGGGGVLHLGQECLILQYLCVMDWRAVEVYCT